MDPVKIPMRLLVIGSGGREHAILSTLERTSKNPLELFCAPGNGGIAQIAECLPISVGDHAALIEFALSRKIDLTVVGPEGPLAEGLVDEFLANGLPIFGPTRAAACLESSKVFAKDFMRRHNIPTAAYESAASPGKALAALRSGRFGPAESPVVVKADGLAAGKGVVVAADRGEAERAVTALTSGAIVSADAASQILIEEALHGPEVSVLLFADGRDYALMPPARDHKRARENDTGPNTGGMGAITDASILSQETLDRIVSEVVEPTLKGACLEGFPFRGILFIGLMLTADGPRVLEYNVRFGDPETQAILVRLESDLAQIFRAVATGGLKDISVDWSKESSACVVLASEGYPGPYPTGLPISGLETTALTQNGVQVFHAGTSIKSNGLFETAGGRVLGITAAGDTLETALDRCYQAVKGIGWKGMQYRRDIGRFREKAADTSAQ